MCREEQSKKIHRKAVKALLTSLIKENIKKDHPRINYECECNFDFGWEDTKTRVLKDLSSLHVVFPIETMKKMWPIGHWIADQIFELWWLNIHNNIKTYRDSIRMKIKNHDRTANSDELEKEKKEIEEIETKETVSSLDLLVLAPHYYPEEVKKVLESHGI